MGESGAVLRTHDIPTGQVGLPELRGLCHDLRQPLAAVSLLAAAARTETVRAQGGPGDVVVERLNAILEQVRWLSQVVDDVLDPSPGHADSAVLDLHAVAEVCAQRAGLVGDCDLRVQGPGRTFVLVPPTGLQRALGNVLENAVRAAGPRGRVDVHVGADRGRARVAVEDSGPGFGHVPTGTSLGLLMVRSFLATCDGDLAVGRSELGGARVVLTLPCLPIARGQR